MYELRKDPILSRWAAIPAKSLKPEEYPSFSAPMKDCVPAPSPWLPVAAPDYITVESGPSGVRVLKAAPFPDESGRLGRRGDGIYDKMNSVVVHEVVLEGQGDASGALTFRPYLDIYLRRISALVKDARLRYVFIFRNMTGDANGSNCGIERLHSEILATPVIPDFIKRELDGAKQYYEYKERCIFCDIAGEEERLGTRVITRTEHFIALCPYAPRQPFEFWIVPWRHSCAFEDISEPELDDLGRLLPELLGRMGRALNHPPGHFYIHTAPNRIPRKNHWHTLGDDYHWHIEVLPGLGPMSAVDLGSGLSFLATSPEDAAQCIRNA